MELAERDQTNDMSEFEQALRKLEHGTKEEKIFAEKTIVQHLPAIHKAIMIIAQKTIFPSDNLTIVINFAII